MNPKITTPRARTKEKKAAQFERILEAGMQLFLDKGSTGFSLRGLANILGMNKNNLYNYVESKRELWIAIRRKFYQKFRDENVAIIKNHKGSTINLILKIYRHFLEFYEDDFGVFLMMHNIIDVPITNKIGSLEKDYREFRLLDGTTRLFKQAITNGEIEEKSPSFISFLTYGMLVGTVFIEAHMRYGFSGTPPQEIIQFSEADFTVEEFRDYVLESIEDFIKRPSSSKS